MMLVRVTADEFCECENCVEEIAEARRVVYEHVRQCRESYDEAFRENDYIVIGRYCGMELCGFIFLYLINNERGNVANCELFYVYVVEGCRNRGIARYLLRVGKKLAANLGCFVFQAKFSGANEYRHSMLNFLKGCMCPGETLEYYIDGKNKEIYTR